MSRPAKRLLGSAATALAIATLGIVAVLWSRDPAGSGTARVERGDLLMQVEATGKLEAAVAFEIGPPSVRDFWNYNLSWMIPEGSQVKQGDVIRMLLVFE